MSSQVGNILLVMTHGDSVVKGAIGRRETLLALFGVMNKLERRERPLLKCLKCLRLLTCDPALLQPLQVSLHCPKDLSYSTSGKFAEHLHPLPKCKCLRLLTCDPALLQPLQVCLKFHA